MWLTPRRASGSKNVAPKLFMMAKQIRAGTIQKADLAGGLVVDGRDIWMCKTDYIMLSQEKQYFKITIRQSLPY